ncbi:hypothetical protein CLV62_11439 [Dysgonomonas alginatilytica]|uniref:Class I SAM-dependent methyltransferase n=1 Tax=Dysgonomonas alginatilytica TaxID=1605892 RepID=A0A2V3PNE9_9BACT|nr:hypothetical protein [Dysgonomonas alginatilytica]PXV63322.1 hypothetical protein CLV62_11439 [Dysgonomonas alginatilytica]
MVFFKELLMLMPISVQDTYLKSKYDNQLSKWEKEGRPIPVPHIVKQNVINAYKKRYSIETLFETGTYLGDMVWAQRNNFKKIYSIELSEKLSLKAQKRFKKYSYINILQGDSGKVLHTLTCKMNEKAIFWLDGHYSGGITAKGDSECPIYGELSAIFKSEQEHVLLIDDARSFTGEGDYPTIEALSGFVEKYYPSSSIDVKEDIIRIELKK